MDINIMSLAGTNRAVRSAGFTLIEVMASVTILAIASGLVIVNCAASDSTERLDRAADQVVAALRFARVEAMGHGNAVSGTDQPQTEYGVSFDTSANTVTVYSTTWNSGWGTHSTVSSDMYTGGSYVIDFDNQVDVKGVTISSVHLTGSSDTQDNTSSPYVCQYTPFGQAENYGSQTAAITLSYGGYTRTISIPQVGDASKN
ncbi:MAG TPA: prepilin-type N-terminal cleavage/methylation domain-containing protein [Tepidisphaeraceae bacterium]|nr:prepilin-type N-terminal cleavage/methylation domain-containing protein [Tepidisphaeraceae bacterium]